MKGKIEQLIRYAKTFAWIFGAKVLTNGKQVFQLSCPLKNLSKEMFFDLISSVIFEKRLSFVFIGMQFCEPVMQRKEKTHFRSRLRINTQQITFRPSALKMLSKETSRDPNVAVIPEKQLSSLWRCKPEEYYTALSKLNMQTFLPTSI